MKNLLFPRPFRVFGFLLFLLAVLLGLVIAMDFDFRNSWLNNYADEVSSIGITVGLIFIGFSQVKDEDEMIRALRLDALQWSTYLNYCLLIIAIIMFYDLIFLRVLIYNMFTTLLVFNFRFAWTLADVKKKSCYAE